MKELGIDPISYVCQGNITYQLVDLSEDNIIQEHCKFLKEKFDIVFTMSNFSFRNLQCSCIMLSSERS